MPTHGWARLKWERWSAGIDGAADEMIWNAEEADLAADLGSSPTNSTPGGSRGLESGPSFGTDRVRRVAAKERDVLAKVRDSGLQAQSPTEKQEDGHDQCPLRRKCGSRFT